MTAYIVSSFGLECETLVWMLTVDKEDKDLTHIANNLSPNYERFNFHGGRFKYNKEFIKYEPIIAEINNTRNYQPILLYYDLFLIKRAAYKQNLISQETITYCTNIGRVDVLEWLFKDYRMARYHIHAPITSSLLVVELYHEYGILSPYLIMDRAIKESNLDILQFILRHRKQYKIKIYRDVMGDMIYSFMSSLEALTYLYNLELDAGETGKFSLSENQLHTILKNGDLGIIRFLWDKTTISTAKLNYNVNYLVYNNIQTIKWFTNNNYHFKDKYIKKNISEKWISNKKLISYY